MNEGIRYTHAQYGNRKSFSHDPSRSITNFPQPFLVEEHLRWLLTQIDFHCKAKSTDFGQSFRWNAINGTRLFTPLSTGTSFKNSMNVVCPSLSSRSR